MNTFIKNCSNCDENGKCYECYILSGDEDRDNVLGIINEGSSLTIREQMHVLSDGEALKRLGFTNSDQNAIESAYEYLESIYNNQGERK